MAKVTWRAEQVLEMAMNWVKAKDFDKALAFTQNAIKLKPDFAEAFGVRGICLLKLQRPFDAIMCLERSLDLKGDQSDVWNNLGIAFSEIGLWESARQAFQRSLQLHKSAEPHLMCGAMFAHNMELEAAEKEFKAALEIEPQLQDAHVKLGVIQLGLGKWKEALENYHWRWYETPFPPRPFRMFETWKGQDLKDKTILIYSEQGFGDEIMSLRFIDPIKKIAKKVIVEVRPTMTRLVDHPHVMAVGDPYPSGIDYSCALLDVPMVLGLTPESMPRPWRYMKTGIPTEWQSHLSKDKFRVGLCWSAGRRPLQPETEKIAAAKSATIELLGPLFEVPGIEWVSLQLPRLPIPKDVKMTDLIDKIDDFYDTAQLMQCLDLVISVDTSVAHLAGALGIRVWNLVRFNGYWPWMSETDETVWYPSMKIFRQPELGYWEPAIEAMTEQLRIEASKHENRVLPYLESA